MKIMGLGPPPPASWCPSIQQCSTVVNLVLKGYHSPLNWLFVPKNNDRTLSQNNECYTLLSAKPWCQREKWHFWGENVRVGNDYKTGEKTCYITKFFREKPGWRPTTQWLKIRKNIAFFQKYKKFPTQISVVTKIFLDFFDEIQQNSGFFR